MSKYKIKVDKEKCIGCGACVAMAPKTFEMTPDGKAVVLKGELDEDIVIRQTAEACPTLAIELEEDGKKVFPEE